MISVEQSLIVIILTMPSNIEDFKIPPLSKGTFQRWKYEAVSGLESVGVYEVVDETEPCPSGAPDDAAVKDWRKRDAKARRIITYALSDEDHTTIRDCRTSAEIWKKIVGLYEVTTDSNKYILTQSLHALKFKDGQSVSSYCAELSVICQRLKAAGETVSETTLVSKLMNNLPPKFDTFRETYLIQAVRVLR